MPRRLTNDHNTGTDLVRLEAVHRGPNTREVAACQRQFLETYPPDGDSKRWWDRLKAALGTSSSDFVNATLVQIQNASRLRSGSLSEMSVNSVLAFIEAAESKNEIEAALAIQMACTVPTRQGLQTPAFDSR
jgi:hypothetical protein